jgi:small-conductance mechanosensitive channel
VTPARAEKVKLNFDDNIQYTCIMKRIALLLIFIFGFLLTQAQQKIRFFKENSDCVSKTYTLPVSVTCTFADGTKKRLMLEKIIGDSLVFEKYYNQDKIYDCSSNKILKMNFHKKGEYVLSPLTVGLVGSALAFGYISLDLLFNLKSEGAVILPVTSVLTLVGGTCSYYLIRNLPSSYKTSKWKIHEK